MDLCPECLGRKFVYSPGGRAPKLPCPICQPSRAPEAAAPKLGKYCHACEAIPIHGYCNLAGCPTGRLRDRDFWAEGCDVFALSEGGGLCIATAADAEIAETIVDALTRTHLQAKGDDHG